MEKMSRVDQDVLVAERNGEKIYQDVLGWRNRVETAIAEEEEKKKLLKDINNNKCFVGFFSNIKTRYKLSRRAEEGATTFDKLITECQFERGVGYRDLPQLMVRTDDFESFKSREKVFNEIVESLKDSSTSMIGVYGMAGVGKTSLVKEVDRQLQEAKFFDSLIAVTVSRVPDIQKIQDQIAESLGLRLEDKSTVVRSRRLCERLKNEQKILIILDDIWKKLDLVEVGIPFGSQHEGCKILLTSRNQNVLSNDMEATKTFRIGDLDEEEAWKFFKMMAGENVESDEELRSTATEVAKKCAGLPLAIATVARALRNKPSFVWRDALQQLQRPSYSGISRSDISAEVYSAIELSFNHLPSEDHKDIFLLCSLLRRNTGIKYLLRYALGLGLIDGVGTVREARDRLLTIISDLKASCLLIPSDSNDESFDVHDLTYIVAKSIASEDNQVFALNEEDVVTDWPDGDSMKKCNKIYLLSCQINHLPDQLNCPELSFFYLDDKDSSLTLPAGIFKEATNLKVLDLTRMHFSSLPSSICLLTSLTTLCLDRGKLGDNITIIGGLKNLEILTFFKSDIRILPKEIGQLVRLKLLDLSHCTKLKTITRGVLSSLSRLEELYMGDTSIEWKVERAGNEQSSASLAELNKLSHLSSLEVQILNLKTVPQEFFQELQELERYKIFIGKEWEWVDNYQYSKTLKLSLSSSIDDLDRGIKMLLRKTEDLYLDEMKGVKIALEELLDEGSLSHFKKLHIQKGLNIEYISNDIYEFPRLQSLTLQDLPQLISFCPQIETGATSLPHQHELPLFSEKISFPCLENLQLLSINVTSIWHNQLSNSSFCTTHEKLTTLKIDKCGNLKHLLSLSMAKCLVHLTDFELIGCNSLTEIIFVEDIEKEEIQATTLSLFPQLKSLELRELRRLIGFLSNFQTDQVVVFPSMKSLKINECPEMEGFICRSEMVLEGSQSMCREVLFDSKVAFPSLEILRISYLRKMRMIWENSLLGNSFSKLQQLGVCGCEQLLTIFPSNNILTAFQGLQVLYVCHSVSLEQVFEVESLKLHEEKETAPPLVFLQLKEICIRWLPKLKYIWKNDPEGIFSFKNLRGMNVQWCSGLKHVFPASIARDLPQLNNLNIGACGVEEIVSKIEEGSNSETSTVVTFKFDQLSSLKLYGLSNCKCFYQGKHTTKWPMLKELHINKCGKMKIFGTQLLSDNGQVESSIHPSLFLVEKVIPKLQRLELGSDCISMISDSQFSSSLFHEIKAFRVQWFEVEPTSFQISLLERFYTLENLSIYNCEIRELFDTEGDTGNTKMYAGSFSTIRNLEVTNVASLKSYLWKQEIRVDNILPHLETLKVHQCHNITSLGSSSALFQNLSTLDVWKCDGMQYLDTCLAIKSLDQLRKLMIRECISMKEIVASEVDEAAIDIMFGRLKSLELVNLPQLESFCSDNHGFGFPRLEDIIVSGCPVLEIFCKGDLQAPLLQRVEDGSGKGHWRNDLNGTIQHLHSTKVGSQGMECFVLSEVSKSIEIWKQGSVDFKKLKVLEVHECNSLEYIFSASTALDLVHLQEIEVKKCRMMEQIIKTGAEETVIDTISLLFLSKIRLESCPKLTCFCLGSVTLQCPDLLMMRVEDCPKMYAMVSTEDVGGKKTPFLNTKVLCANLFALELLSTNIQKLWPDKPHKSISSNVHNLGVLVVKGCHNLEYLFPSFLIKKLTQLGLLILSNCDSMEHVIFTDGLATAAATKAEEISDICLFPRLEQLKLSKLPKLGTFCHGDNSETDAPSLFNHKVAFPSLNVLVIKGMGKVRKIWQDKVTVGSFCELTKLWVRGCERLSNIMPFNLVERLEKLETLRIWECESVEEIIRPDDDDDDDDDRLKFNESHTVTSAESIEFKSTTKFVFPKISFLSLYNLPKLKAFYPKAHTTEWPSLKLLEVNRCNKIETFAGEYINFGETQGENQRVISVQQPPLFLVTEDTFPNLEELYLLRNENMKEIWHGPHPTQYFCKPRILELSGFPRASVTIPTCFIRPIPNSEELSVEEATFYELCPSEGDEDAGTLAHSKESSKKEPSLAQVLCNLEILPVGECGKLKNLVQSFASFEHLTTLEVSKCHGFRYLVTLTIAKSMVQLKRLVVIDCQMLEEIIASTTGEVKDVIVFNQLESLKLDRLPRLSSFCSETCNLVFHNLEEVIMGQCPKMEFFTEGKISTPMLRGVQSTEGEYVGRWEGNLNAIIQQLFVEKVFPSLEDLEMSSMNIQRVWNHKLPALHTYAQNLTCLTIEGCHNLSCLFSSSMVKCFVQLKKLNIENCENVKHVIFMEGLSKEETINQKLFRVLESLSLKDLPKLKRFCHGNYFEFPLLTSLGIERCPALKTFIFDAQGDSPALFDEKVAFPFLQELSIQGVGNWRNIWQKQPTNCDVQIQKKRMSFRFAFP